ncbi:capsular exopolysaccharide family [Saccharicrinis carchari]|uniref:non-specific protein-tyrosine kinase n=1 Tax=Saccharicrinis carchari TaxID=1168039 RepID=A0A521EP94_SACCC|nr:tyrosine-protein kinase [Saccharicrinis carchari]SMO85736.1 capsular exopolysaccharide family [Saccharicrinis carchari]
MSIKNKVDQDNYVDIRKVFKHLLKNWIWFAVSLLLLCALAMASLKVLKPKYLVSSSIYIKDDKRLGGQKAAEFIQSFSMFDQKSNFKNEMLILNSSPLIRQTITALELETEYYAVGNFMRHEIYRDAPFLVLIDSMHNQIVDTYFDVVFKEDGKFTLSAKSKDYKTFNYSLGTGKPSTKEFELEKEFFQSAVIKGDDYHFKIYLNPEVNIKEIAGNRYSFKFLDREKLVRQYQSNLKVNPVNAEVSVVQLSLKLESAAKGVDFMKALMDLYLKKNLERKNHLASNTIAFINGQLDEISDSLSFAESNLEEFRSTNQVMDINTKAMRILERLQQLEIQKSTTERAYNYYEYLDDYFKEGDDYSKIVVPSSIGLNNATINEFIRDLLILSNQRNDLISRNQQKGPFFENLQIKIENLRNSIIDNISFSKESLKREVEKFQDQIRQLEKQVESLPKTERTLVGMERKFKLNDAIYTFLLEKRAEAQIAKAGNLPEHEIVEPARVLEKVFPNPKIHFLLALFLGLFIPAIVLVISNVADDRVKSEQELTEHFSDTPFVGSVVKSHEKESNLVVHDNPTSIIAETFRSIRTNLSFFNEAGKHQTILLTSCIAGEGKSFVANNLAVSMANLGKKTVVIGFDLRKSGQFQGFKHNAKIGLSSYYLKDKSLEDIVYNTGIENLHFIAPGLVPPNPLELIGSGLTGELFDSLKTTYDCIIVDTPPIGVLSDGYMLMNYADVNLFVVREKFTNQKVLGNVISEVKQKGFKNIGLVLNASKLEGKKYRYDYYNAYNNPK